MDSDGRRSHAKSFREGYNRNSAPSVAKNVLSPRTPSLSSLRTPCSSDDSLADYDPPFPSFRFSGVPFSWEHSPGIPKERTADQVDHSLVIHLPLPPSIASPSVRKLKLEEKKRDSSGEEKGEDPFFAALIECSKRDYGLRSSEIWSNSKVVSTGISDRFKFICLYCPCKRIVHVADSLVYLPKSTGNSFQIAANDRLRNCK